MQLTSLPAESTDRTTHQSAVPQPCVLSPSPCSPLTRPHPAGLSQRTPSNLALEPLGGTQDESSPIGKGQTQGRCPAGRLASLPGLLTNRLHYQGSAKQVARTERWNILLLGEPTWTASLTLVTGRWGPGISISQRLPGDPTVSPGNE